MVFMAGYTLIMIGLSSADVGLVPSSILGKDQDFWMRDSNYERGTAKNS
jgi:hypothetical protein